MNEQRLMAAKRFLFLKWVHWHKEDLAQLSTSPRVQGYQFEFKGIRIVPGLYIGLFNGRRKRLRG